jgi:methylmalonyl-CoA mutase N-terminal domain/subunit
VRLQAGQVGGICGILRAHLRVWCGDRRESPSARPLMLGAARAEATLGEICDALRSEWGAYTGPAAF